MNLLLTYDVNTESPEGRRRLRKVAKKCQCYGQRVQKSVFECKVGEKEYIMLENTLRKIIDPNTDSVRIYFLSETAIQKIVNIGNAQVIDYEDPLIV
ncbi:CRISPR-associated endonuclease Cas2 [bacterium]|nr:CRISPR-associated endonuclease Cas2 [bacterium]